MVQEFGERQQVLLRLLLENKAGMTVDALVKALGISRTAVNQHLTALEHRGYVEKGALTQTGGRPGYAYALTPSGTELFPKQYSWFSELLLKSLEAQLGRKGLATFLGTLGAELSEEHRERIHALSPQARVQEVVKLMQTLGYEAVMEKIGEQPVIRAQNCVYHRLASKYNEVCEFDISLIGGLLDADINHEQCMVRGDGCCRFAVLWRQHD
jgi:predicted ArsR family transcriptional regulator